jgi:hypothetical protein
MLEISCDAVAAGEERFVSCAAEQSKYFSICTVILGPCGDLPFTSWGRWQCLRGGADVDLTVVMPSAVAAQNIGVRPCQGEALCDMLEAMARIAPSLPSEAMARIAPRRNGTMSLDPNCRVKIPEQGSFELDWKFFSKVQIDSKIGLGSAVPKKG